MDYTLLKTIGIDYEKAIERCMGNEALYLQLLASFPEDTCLQQARQYYQAGEYENAYACLHELKGESGNLGIKAVYDLSCDMLHLLRENRPEELPVYFERLSSAYDLAVHSILETLHSQPAK